MNDDGAAPGGDEPAVPVLIGYGTRSGGATLDADDQGGNPFASALIELVNNENPTLEELMPRLGELTARKSNGIQTPEHRGNPGRLDWRFSERKAFSTERREALVLVVSDYSASDSGFSLWGAAFDERRIAALLAQHGFCVTQGVVPTGRELRRALTSFGPRSQNADVGIIYSTGHGSERNGEVYLLPGDCPIASSEVGPRRRQGISVTQMAAATRARSVNAVFFAGGRTL